MSLLFLSVCLFLFSFCSLSLCMSPATHYVGPCHEFEISGVTARKEKKSCHPNTHLIFYTTKWLLFAERRRHREKNIPRVQLSVSSDSPAFASNISKNSNWRFYCSTVWLTLAHRQRGQPVNRLSAASIEFLSWGWLGPRPPPPPPFPHVA